MTRYVNMAKSGRLAARRGPEAARHRRRALRIRPSRRHEKRPARKAGPKS
jgi:hypothetical protein